MLDVHPPHHPVHAWRDFFIHIATIVVGLLIAVGLEQTVEAIHHHRQRDELREALSHESEQIIRECSESKALGSANLAWIINMEQQVSEATRLHHPVGALPERPIVSANVPDDPIFRAATASNELSLLSRPEVEAYSEVHSLLTEYQIVYHDMIQDRRNFMSFLHDQSFGKTSDLQSLADASLADQKTAYDLMGKMEATFHTGDAWISAIAGAETAVLQGERDIRRIEDAEKSGPITTSSKRAEKN